MKKYFINYFKKSIISIVLIGFNVSQAGSFDDFFKAVKMDNAKAVQQLLARGFDANTIDQTGQTGLFIAIREPSSKVARLLVDSPKIDLNALNTQGESPLMLAALKGQLELANQMVKKGADPTLKNQQGLTAVQFAQRASRPDAVELITKSIRAQRPPGQW